MIINVMKKSHNIQINEETICKQQIIRSIKILGVLLLVWLSLPDFAFWFRSSGRAGIAICTKSICRCLKIRSRPQPDSVDAEDPVHFACHLRCGSITNGWTTVASLWAVALALFTEGPDGLGRCGELGVLSFEELLEICLKKLKIFLGNPVQRC